MRIPNQSPGVNRTNSAKAATAKVGEVGIYPSSFCGSCNYYCTQCRYRNHSKNNNPYYVKCHINCPNKCPGFVPF